MTTSPPKCYSYCRFSSKNQAKGHSLQRQIELSEKWASDNGLVLEKDAITDLGVSGYNKFSNNLRNGALGQFLEQIKKGKIPPKSTLIVESLDRLSRGEILTAFDLFREIIKHDIKIVTLTDYQEYDEESLNNNIGQLMISLTIMARAFEESDTKSKRLKAVWNKKREKIKNKPLTAICPMWLKLNAKTKKFQEIPERVAIVKRIFEMSADGYGYQSIIKKLNEENIPSFRGKSWGQTSLRNILHGKAVLGEFIPHIKENGRRIPLEPIQNYYPQIISYNLYQKVHDRFNSFERNRGGGKNGSIRNLFGRITRCGYCNSTMRFIYKGPSPKGGQYLKCTSACLKNEPDCFNVTWRYEEIEESFLNISTELSVSDILDSTSHTENVKKIESIQEQISNLNEIKKKKSHNYENGYKSVTNIIQNTSSLGKNKTAIRLMKDLDKIQDVIENIENKIHLLEVKISNIKNSDLAVKEHINSMKELIRLISYQNNKPDPEKFDLRFKLRNEIRNLIKRIYFLPAGNIINDNLANSIAKKLTDHYAENNIGCSEIETNHAKELIIDHIRRFNQPIHENRCFIIVFNSGSIKAVKFDNEDKKMKLKAIFDIGGKIRVEKEGIIEMFIPSKMDEFTLINDIIEQNFMDYYMVNNNILK